MNRQRLLQSETFIDDEIAQYEDELSYLRAAKKNIRYLIEKEPNAAPKPVPPDETVNNEPNNIDG